MCYIVSTYSWGKNWFGMMVKDDVNLICNIVTAYKVNVHVFMLLFVHVNTENEKKTALVI